MADAPAVLFEHSAVDRVAHIVRDCAGLGGFGLGAFSFARLAFAQIESEFDWLGGEPRQVDEVEKGDALVVLVENVGAVSDEFAFAAAAPPAGHGCEALAGCVVSEGP